MIPRRLFPLLAAVILWSRSSPARSELILNEALANEIGSATTLEWVEVLNWPDTGSASVSLQGFRYIDGGDTSVIDVDAPILPGGFAVLARKAIGASSFESRWGNNSGIWGDDSNESYPVIEVSSISLRNSSDTVLLLSPWGDRSTMLWTSSQNDGVSLERIRPGGSDRVSGFESCQDPSGSTPGRANSVLPPPHDLEIDSIVVGPLDPAAGETVHFAVHIENVGYGAVNGSSISLWRSGVIIASSVLASVLEEGDTTVVLNWENATPGIGHFVVTLSPDSDTANNGAVATVTVRFTEPTIVISEYLANPEPGGPDEWIEIVNLGGSSISLEGMRIGDSLNTEAIPAPPTAMPSSAFWVLVENVTAFQNHYPSFSGVVIGIPGWRALNNTGDKIRLLGPMGEIVDSLTFSTPFDENRSVERVELLPKSAATNDWTVSIDLSGATPGLPNSEVRGHPGRLVIDSVWVRFDSSEPNLGLSVFASVTNVGFGPAFSGNLYLGRTLDPTAPGMVTDTIGTAAIPVTEEGQTRILPLVWEAPPPGIHRLVSWFAGDDGSEVGQPGVALATVPFTQPGLIISEFMAAPESDGPDEWIEIYNASGIALSTRGIQLGNSAGSYAFFPDQPVLDPGTFTVVAQDPGQFASYYQTDTIPMLPTSVWPSLNGNGDLIRLLGPTGEIIDSISTGQRNKGTRSIERRQLVPAFADPRDWGVSIDPSGATPGRPNSIRRLLNDLSLDSISVDSTSQLAGDRITGTTWVSNVGFDTVRHAGITITYEPYSGLGLKGFTFDLAPGHVQADQFTWTDVPPGNGILRARIPPDENPSNDTSSVPVVVLFAEPSIIVTEFLADPAGGGPEEWVEIVNLSGFVLDLNGIALGDSANTAVIEDVTEYFRPGEFLVLVEDKRAFQSFYPALSGPLIELPGWPSLNNNGDRIRLTGHTGEIIDSLSYLELYGENHSRERVTLAPTFASPNDWAMSVDPAGATPGRANSVDAAAAGPLRVDVSPNPFFRASGQTAEIRYQLDIGERLTLKIFDRDGRLVKTLSDDQPAASGLLLWDGTGDDGSSLRPGPYVLLARSEPAGSTKKQVVVIAP